MEHTHNFLDKWEEVQVSSRKNKDGYYTIYKQRQCTGCRAKEIKAVFSKKIKPVHDH